MAMLFIFVLLISFFKNYVILIINFLSIVIFCENMEGKYKLRAKCETCKKITFPYSLTLPTPFLKQETHLQEEQKTINPNKRAL